MLEVKVIGPKYAGIENNLLTMGWKVFDGKRLTGNVVSVSEEYLSADRKTLELVFSDYAKREYKRFNGKLGWLRRLIANIDIRVSDLERRLEGHG